MQHYFFMLSAFLFFFLLILMAVHKQVGEVKGDEWGQANQAATTHSLVVFFYVVAAKQEVK